MNTAKIILKVIPRIIVPKVSKANLVLTFNCNHKCVTCNIWKTHGRNLIKGAKYPTELTVEEIEKIVTRNNLIYISLTGGEPFLRKDIGDIIRVCLQHVPMVTITTNGSLPKIIEKAAKQALLKTNNLLDINVSFDGNKEQHDAFTQIEGSYERVTETIKRLAKLRAKMNGKLKLSIEELVSVHTEAGREHVAQFAKQMNIPLTYSIEQKAPFYDNEDNVLVKGKMPSTKMRLSPHDIFSHLYIQSSMNGHIPKCVAAQYTCSITPYGDVMPCLFLPITLKNLRETDYVIGKLDYKEAVGTCKRRCWTPCEAYPTIMFRPWRLL